MEYYCGPLYEAQIHNPDEVALMVAVLTKKICSICVDTVIWALLLQ